MKISAIFFRELQIPELIAECKKQKENPNKTILDNISYCFV